MMSTQTQPAASDTGEPTAVVADRNATELARLAWSTARDYSDDDDLYGAERDRTTLWLRFFVGVVAAAIVAILAVTLWSVLSDRQEPAAAVAVPTSSAPDVVAPSTPAPEPSPTPEPAPTPPLIIAAPPPVTTEAPPPVTVAPPIDHDTAFLTELTNDGIEIFSTPAAIAGGHDVCLYIDQGHTPEQAVEVSMRTNSSLTPVNARAYVIAAVHAYCPRDGG